MNRLQQIIDLSQSTCLIFLAIGLLVICIVLLRILAMVKELTK